MLFIIQAGYRCTFLGSWSFVSTSEFHAPETYSRTIVLAACGKKTWELCVPRRSGLSDEANEAVTPGHLVCYVRAPINFWVSSDTIIGIVVVLTPAMPVECQ